MASFIDNKLIFSDERKYRITRHLLFWGVWYIHIALTHAANPFGSPEISYFKNPVFTFLESFFVILAQIPFVYTMLYFVLPRLIMKRHYALAFLAIVALWILCGVMNVYFTTNMYPRWLSYILPEQYLAHTQRLGSVSFFMGIMATNKGAFTMSALALMLKFIKYWYVKDQRNLQLQKENAEAQMRLLTAQVHPHFLFNTLNNIYSQTQTESPKGSKMIMGLSDMLRYILYEGSKPLVPLNKELTMITEYISLEKIRYGNKLDVHVLIPDKTNDVYIAPLLLLPFIENCFKHGASNMLQAPWINLTVEMKETRLVMKLMNGKASLNQELHPKKGIGIDNVRQRLDLLYKNKYDLQIREDEEVFVVDLKVELIRMNEGEHKENLIKSQPIHVYA
jgi:sensor histidine kinase YesM